MARKIQLVSNEISFPFVDENDKTIYTVTFDKRDENIKRVLNLQEELNQLEKIEDIDEAKVLLEECVDSMFGEGTFTTMYKHNPSVQAVSTYVLALGKAIQEEYFKDTERSLLNKHTK